MNKQRLYWIFQIGGWSLYGVANLVTFSFSGRITNDFIFGEVFQVLYYLISTHIFRAFIKKFDWYNMAWHALIPRLILSAFILGVINSTINYLLLAKGISGAVSQYAGLIIVSMILYLLWSIIYFMFHYFESYRQALKREATLNEIELNNLKSQLNPHFIFNALNSIRALVDEDPDKSKSAITQLSNILRNSLTLDKSQLIDFEDEMSTVKDYLALETIRYEERLQTSVKLHPESAHYKIPPMMIQTLVENGIKHGVANLKKGGKVSVETDIDGGIFVIKIRNSGEFLNGADKSSGYGIVNTKKRLKLIYGDSASFSIINEAKNTVLTEIRIPENIR
ncbi:MAG: histidine kinase [Bacteroidetes bacterium]|nr:histidine kinase [Bacteroidota bacterium]MDA1119171.1 histidine kinase [Bacteroidota bacterium]